MRNLILSILLVLVIIGAASADGKKIKKDTAVEPTSWGKVLGQVYDADTGAPINGAVVAIQNEGEFSDKGNKNGKTDSMGRYECEAIIGRVSENFDVGRAMLSSPIGLLFGSATNKTRRIDIASLNIRVTRDGYKPFEGVVMCRKTNPEKFNVTMQPILLAASGGADVSTTAEGWGIVSITDVTSEPSILRPGMKAVITVKVKSPPILNLHDLKVNYWNHLDNNVAWQGKELKAQGNAVDGVFTFTGNFTAPKVSAVKIGALDVCITNCPYDVAKDGMRKSILLQVVTNDAEGKAAGSRAEIFRLEQDGENVDAAARLKELCALPETTLWDYDQLAHISETVHDNETAISAFKKVLELTPEKPEDQHMNRIGEYATALVADNEGEKVLSDYSPMVDAIKEKDRPARIPASLMVALGNAYLQQDKLTEAEAISQALLKWPDFGGDENIAMFRNALKLAQLQETLKANPNDTQCHVDYGHFLMDQGKWEEAVEELRTALKADTNQPAVQRDLTYAVLHIRGGMEEAKKGLDDALASAKKATIITDSKGKIAPTKDFFAWHKLGILLYCKARQQESAQDPAATATFAECSDAIRNALKSGRSGAHKSYGEFAGQFGYLSGSQVAISGFDYPEANSDFLLLECLRTLENHPDDYLAYFNLGTALIDLGQIDLADESIRKTLELKPNYTEAKYDAALIALQRGDRDTALADLKEVLQENPRHSHANLMLAKLYTEDGDTADATSCLAAHARFYGSSN